MEQQWVSQKGPCTYRVCTSGQNGVSCLLGTSYPSRRFTWGLGFCASEGLEFRAYGLGERSGL